MLCCAVLCCAVHLLSEGPGKPGDTRTVVELPSDDEDEDEDEVEDNSEDNNVDEAGGRGSGGGNDGGGSVGAASKGIATSAASTAMNGGEATDNIDEQVSAVDTVEAASGGGDAGASALSSEGSVPK